MIKLMKKFNGVNQMKLARSAMISKIDTYSKEELGIPIKSLMEKSGTAVANVIKERAPKGKYIVILAGKGNNGGDGYAAAVQIMDEYHVTVYNIFDGGQKSQEGREFLEEFRSRGGKILNFEPTEEILSHIKNAGCIVDAVFGTGFHGEMPESIRPLAITIRESVEAEKIAIDVPLGINADNGTVSDFAISVGATVELSYIKPGIISYPARSYVGKVIYDDLGLPKEEIEKFFPFKYHMIDSRWASRNLPVRESNSNKGTFGKLLMITGSKKYRGAAHLSLEAALRGGVGLVNFLGTHELVSELSQKYPEAVYTEVKDLCDFDGDDIQRVVKMSASCTATLIGSGSDNTDGLLRLTLALLDSEGGTLILDADAINSLASIGKDGIKAIKNSKREVVITPHPLEFARLYGTEVALVQQHRLESAEGFAMENSCIVVLKGAGTIITDGGEVYINSAGTSALAKAGSGDVLAGFLAALVAQMKGSVRNAAALAVYYHALAGESLAEEYSSYGVTPSDIPCEIARQLAKTHRKQ
ncbi:MAG: NAD(P)H-hydrate dehydratase [Ruminococcaceae bacterium]|nr:NAD(P)H-hydrate dehydratase [Oscillospiraceae bacterium]